MGDGLICIHTSHNADLRRKLEIDISSLKRWIFKYYFNKKNDNHYEHIIFKPKAFENIYFSYFFTEVDYSLIKTNMVISNILKMDNGLYS